MAKAIFTTAETTAYKDEPALRYHFPKTYLQQANNAVGDWVAFYEPRRNAGPSSSGGSQSYFAVAKVIRVRPDLSTPDHYFADLTGYTAFDRLVPFKVGTRYYESALRRADGHTNKGAFGRSIRIIPQDEFAAILAAGLDEAQNVDEFDLEAPETQVLQASETIEQVQPREIVQRLISVRNRSESFKRQVRLAYDNTCAITGLRIIDLHGRPEVQAAHLRAVSADGPDVVYNGIALTGTMHWLFDRGLISLTDECVLLVSPHGVPDQLNTLFPKDGQVQLPKRVEEQPHPAYLGWHRSNVFKR